MARTSSLFSSEPEHRRLPAPLGRHQLKGHSRTVSVSSSRLGRSSGWCRCSLFVTRFSNDRTCACPSSDLSERRVRCRPGVAQGRRSPSSLPADRSRGLGAHRQAAAQRLLRPHRRASVPCGSAPVLLEAGSVRWGQVRRGLSSRRTRVFRGRHRGSVQSSLRGRLTPETRRAACAARSLGSGYLRRGCGSSPCPARDRRGRPRRPGARDAVPDRDRRPRTAPRDRR